MSMPYFGALIVAVLELVGHFGRIVGRYDDVAARGVDLIGQRQRDGLARNGFVKVASGRDDAGDG